jgi:hypothetical protein
MKALLLSLLVSCASEPAFDPARCEVRTYRIDAFEVARSNDEARAIGFDLNDDGVPDNQIGQVATAVTYNFKDVPLDLEATAAAHFATDTDWRIAFASNCPGGTERMAVTAGGDQPVFDLEVERVDAAVTARGPTAALPITALFDGSGTAVPIFVTAVLARLEVEDLDEEALTARLGTAAEAVAQQLLMARAMTPFLDAHIDEGLFAFADTNGDGSLAEVEIFSDGLVQSLLATDLTIGDVDALSFSLRVHATRLR